MGSLFHASVSPTHVSPLVGHSFGLKFCSNRTCARHSRPRIPECSNLVRELANMDMNKVGGGQHGGEQCGRYGGEQGGRQKKMTLTSTSTSTWKSNLVRELVTGAGLRPGPTKGCWPRVSFELAAQPAEPQRTHCCKLLWLRFPKKV